MTKKMVSIYINSDLHKLASSSTSNFSELIEQLIIESGIDPNAVGKLELRKTELQNQINDLDVKIIKVKDTLDKQQNRIDIANELFNFYNERKDKDGSITIDKVINAYFRKYPKNTILDKNIITKLVKEKVV